jgi:chemotaxis protein methyltransferase CheR
MDDQQFFQVLYHFGLSRAGYRKVRKGVKKRIRRHMQRLSCNNVGEYLLALDKTQEMRQEFDRLMTVSISRFFRDRALWEILESQTLPDFIGKHKGVIRVWSAGCACGEEVYSLKILFERLRGRFRCLPRFIILATDMNPIYLQKAGAGIYPASSLREVSEETRSIYFEPQKGGKRYLVAPSLRDDILWKEHNFLTNAPGSDFHFVFLRNNLLTYYNNELKEPAFRRILDSLVPGGFLIIGAHEKLPVMLNLIPFCRHPYVFQKGDDLGAPAVQ